MKKRGFTLIEMLIVIVIIGILAGALIPRIGNARDKAQDVATQADVNSITVAGLQAIIDGESPCGTDNVIDYSAMNNYGMNNLGTGYHCKQVAKDHIVVWTDGGMKVTSNNNCASTSITSLNSGSLVSEVLAVVNEKDGSGNAVTYNVYCLAQ